MRIRLAFVAVTVAALSAVGCQPDSERPNPNTLPACASEDGTGGPLPCIWNRDLTTEGLTVINFPDGSWCYPLRSGQVWASCKGES